MGCIAGRDTQLPALPAGHAASATLNTSNNPKFVSLRDTMGPHRPKSLRCTPRSLETGVGKQDRVTCGKTLSERGSARPMQASMPLGKLARTDALCAEAHHRLLVPRLSGLAATSAGTHTAFQPSGHRRPTASSPLRASSCILPPGKLDQSPACMRAHHQPFNALLVPRLSGLHQPTSLSSQLRLPASSPPHDQHSRQQWRLLAATGTQTAPHAYGTQRSRCWV